MHRRLVLLALLVVMVGSSCGVSTEGKFGQELFQVTCATCHSRNLGGGIGPAIGPQSNAATALSDEQIGNTIRIGPGRMPSFKQRSDDQIDSLTTYIRSVQGGG